MAGVAGKAASLSSSFAFCIFLSRFDCNQFLMEPEQNSESPVSSPDIEYYEECVVAEEDIILPSKQMLADQSLPASNKPKRIVKKSKLYTVCFECWMLNWSRKIPSNDSLVLSMFQIVVEVGQRPAKNLPANSF